MAKDKGKGKETKPSSEIEDGAVKAKEVEAENVPAFQSSQKEDPLLQPRPKAVIDRVRFLVRQSLGFSWQHISCAHKCENDPRLIKQINKHKDRQVSCFSTLIVEHLVVRRKGVHQVIPPLLLSYRRYHPYLLDCYLNKIVYNVPFLYLIKRAIPFTL